jgi:hypothetical protein
MHTRTRILITAVAAVTLAGGAAAAATAQASAHTINAGAAQVAAPAPRQLSLLSQLTSIRFFSNSGPIKGWPNRPLVPGDRIIGQDRILQHGVPAGHDNEACTVSFHQDVLCQDIVILNGQGDLQASWTLKWPASGHRGPTTFDGIIDGGTGTFAATHGTFHAQAQPNGERLTITLGSGG